MTHSQNGNQRLSRQPYDVSFLQAEGDLPPRLRVTSIRSCMDEGLYITDALELALSDQPSSTESRSTPQSPLLETRLAATTIFSGAIDFLNKSRTPSEENLRIGPDHSLFGSCQFEYNGRIVDTIPFRTDFQTIAAFHSWCAEQPDPTLALESSLQTIALGSLEGQHDPERMNGSSPER